MSQSPYQDDPHDMHDHQVITINVGGGHSEAFVSYCTLERLSLRSVLSRLYVGAVTGGLMISSGDPSPC